MCSSWKIFSHTFARIVESRNRVGGKGTFSLAGATGWMARLEDDGLSFIKVSGSVEVLVLGCWLSMTCLGTFSSGTSCSETTSSGTGSKMRTFSSSAMLRRD